MSEFFCELVLTGWCGGGWGASLTDALTRAAAWEM